MADIQIKGMPQLLAKLKRLDAEVAGQALENALVSGALLIANAAKDNAPYITGNLKRSIHVGGHLDATPLADTTGTDIGGNKHTATSAEVQVGTNVKYAKRIEYGFSDTDKLGRSYNQPAKPYLRPAVDEKAEAAARETGAALKILVDKAVR